MVRDGHDHDHVRQAVAVGRAPVDIVVVAAAAAVAEVAVVDIAHSVRPVDIVHSVHLVDIERSHIEHLAVAALDIAVDIAHSPVAVVDNRIVSGTTEKNSMTGDEFLAFHIRIILAIHHTYIDIWWYTWSNLLAYCQRNNLKCDAIGQNYVKTTHRRLL